jgi:hypothetical protein
LEEIGSSITVYVDAGVCLYYPLTNNLDIVSGVSFSHFSNGGFERLQRGINAFAPYFDLRHNLAGRPNVRAVPKVGRLKRFNELILMLGYGDHQLVDYEYGSEYYAVAGFSVFYLMQHSNAIKSGLGIDTNFFWALSPLTDGMQGPVGWDNLTLGLIYQPELIIGRLSIVSSIGIYARHLKYGDFKQLYQRLRVKYHLNEKLFVGVNIRAIDYIGAEFLKFNLGLDLDG